MLRTKLYILCWILIACVRAADTAIANGTQLWHVGDTAYSAVACEDRLAVQFGGELEPLRAETFASSHAFILDTVQPEHLGRGFTIYRIDSSVGFATARSQLIADANVHRVFPVYTLLPDIGVIPVTDLVSVKFYPDLSVATALNVLYTLGLDFVDSSRYEHNVWECAIPDTAHAGPLP